MTVRLSQRLEAGVSTVSVEVRVQAKEYRTISSSKIWDPFVTTKSQGSGLGLSICQGIIEAHREQYCGEQYARSWSDDNSWSANHWREYVGHR